MGWLNRGSRTTAHIREFGAVGVSLALLPIVSTLLGLMLILAVFGAGSGINRPPTFGLISIHSPARSRE